MKIKEGKYYRTRDGRKVGPIVFNSNKAVCGTHELGTTIKWYTRDGRCSSNMNYRDDLIAEWVDDYPETPKAWKDLTPEEKGALMLAHHEGKVIEFYNHEDEDWKGTYSPVWLQDLIYRIKPEPARKTVTLYGAGWHYEQAEIPCDDDTHRITFDLVDDEPDTDSIKMEKL